MIPRTPSLAGARGRSRARVSAPDSRARRVAPSALASENDKRPQRQQRKQQQQQSQPRRRPPSPPRRPAPSQASPAAAEAPTREDPGVSSSTLRGSVVGFRRGDAATVETRGGQEATTASAPSPPSWLDGEIRELSAVASGIRTARESAERDDADADAAVVALLLARSRVLAFLESDAGHALEPLVSSLPPEDAALLWTLPAIGQGHVLASVLLPEGGEGEDPSPSTPTTRADVDSGVVLSRLVKLANGTLRPVDRFYEPVGGLAGYQLACLRLLRAGSRARRAAATAGGDSSSVLSPSSPSLSSSPAALPGARVSPPPGPDLSDEREASAARAAGLRSLPRTAEVVPLGGAGDRLGLSCEVTGEALPAALLPYAGRSLLEGIVRDLQAREYLYWRAFGGGEGGREGEEKEGEEGSQPPPTRVALMTSCAKGGDGRVRRLLERRRWFGRGASSFRIFCQPQVPLVAASDGRWLTSGAGSVERRPGGHGALWKVLSDGGGLRWLREGGATAAVVRQINNPLAGTDGTLLALAGEGAARRAAFGFACCPRRPGAAEGAVVLVELPGSGPDSSSTAHVTCVEYTEFEAAGLGGEELEALPANSNLLFVDLGAAEAAVAGASSPPPFLPSPGDDEDDVSSLASGCMPGVVFNSSKEVEWRDVSGASPALVPSSTSSSSAAASAAASAASVPFPIRREPAGRLESTMQNLVDHMPAARAAIRPSGVGGGAEGAFAFDASAAAAAADDDDDASSSPASPRHLPTFALCGPRRRITSSAKRARSVERPGAAQTPEGSFLDLTRNAADLLARCRLSLPLPGFDDVDGSSPPPPALAAGDAVDAERLLAGRPPFLFLFHPALGPTWEVVCQKLRGGKLSEGAELVLEVAEARVVDLDVRGSLVVTADEPLGHWVDGGGGAFGEKTVTYSSRNGRARLERVSVVNEGIDWNDDGNVPWRHLVKRTQSCRIRLRGRSELDARGVTLRGDLSFDVPDGKRLVLRPKGGDGGGDGGDEIVATLHDLEDGSRPSWEWRVTERRGGIDALPGLDLELVENERF